MQSTKPEQVCRHQQNGKTVFELMNKMQMHISFDSQHWKKKNKKGSLCELAMCKVLWKVHSCWMDQIISKDELLSQLITYINQLQIYAFLLYHRCCSFILTKHRLLLGLWADLAIYLFCSSNGRVEVLIWFACIG